MAKINRDYRKTVGARLSRKDRTLMAAAAVQPPAGTIPVDQFIGFKKPETERADHWHQFVNAILGKDKTQANFDYAGPLTEAVLLGSLATRFPKTTLEWNAKKLKFTNVKAANQFVRRKYRKGWEVAGLS